MKHVVIVDDDQRTRRVLQILVEKLGLESRAFAGAPEALDDLRADSAALVLTDLKMPRMDGLALMRKVRELDAEVPIIMLSAYGTVESAVQAMKLGAVDFLAKPFDVDALEVLIQRSLEVSRVRVEHRFLRERDASGGELIAGRSVAMRAVVDLIEKVAPTRSAVLVTGETGTGKELVARAVHRKSPRRDQLFVPLNCTAIPAELLESELFGHVRGAFSGARSNRIGKFQAADGGTLFFDEIGDMEPRLQAKLLRVVQEGVIEPVGSNRRIPVDVRIVSSTHRDLERAITSGAFREDLYYRLNVFRIELPPLRERAGDVALLATTFLAELGRELGKGEIRLEPVAASLLESYGWPGNVRELRNVMERACVLCESPLVDHSLLASLLPQSSAGSPPPQRLAARVAAAERQAIQSALAASGDNKARAASLLGIGERTLWTKIKKHGI